MKSTRDNFFTRTISTMYLIWFIIFVLSYLLIRLRIDHIGGMNDEKRRHYRKWYMGVCRRLFTRMPFNTVTIKNPYGETLEKPALCICNHVSLLDAPFLMGRTTKLMMVTEKEVFANPFFGPFVRMTECLNVSEGVTKTKERIKEWMDKGYSVLIFPEGQRTYHGRIQRFHTGAFRIAADLGCDVVPVCTRGLFTALRPKTLVLHPCPLELEIGKRFTVPKDADIFAFAKEQQARYTLACPGPGQDHEPHAL
ncbi:MAG: 1-acyl-sn-glycerol-3-phosphate acyltransferase [Bacteroidales bacterium]|nr:1-acyl-sn-glycerol-3-phosphate acyltransferase [Bacteroidales bacterium]